MRPGLSSVHGSRLTARKDRPLTGWACAARSGYSPQPTAGHLSASPTPSPCGVEGRNKVAQTTSTERLEPPRHGLTKCFYRGCPCETDDALHDAKQVLVAVLDFLREEFRPFLQALAFGNVDRHAHETDYIPVLIDPRGLCREPVTRGAVRCSQLFLYLAPG